MEAIAVEFGVSGRTIQNVIRRRLAAQTKAKAPAVTADEGTTISSDESEPTPVRDDSTSGSSAQEGAQPGSKED